MRKKLFALLLIFAIFAAPKFALAADPEFKDMVGPLTEFCEKRTGDVANLETWYSGKCKPDGDTLTGDGVGFADIVFLDFAERVLGPQSNGNSSMDMLKKLMEKVGTINNTQGMTPGQKANAILSAKIEMVNKVQPALGMVGSVVASLLNNPPASTSQYLAYVNQNLASHQIVKPALAQTDQGFGFNTFYPFVDLWRAFRNVAYTLFVVVFVIYGFMIMFRFKINPQTVISIESAIPKLITVLLVITFSFAIVGLIWDASQFVFFAFYNLLKSNGILMEGPLGGAWGPELASARYGGLLISFIFNMIIAVIISPLAIIGTILGGNEFLSGVLAGAIGIGGIFITGIGILIMVILFLAIFISYFKLFKALLMSFIDLVIGLIFAPIELLQGVMPGNKTIENWIMKMFASAMVFPAASCILMLSYILMVQPIYGLTGWIDSGLSAIANAINPGSTFNPMQTVFGVKNFVTAIYNPNAPLIGTGTTIIGGMNIPLISILGATPSAVMGLIGLGLLLMAAKYTDMVKEALKVPPSKYGSAVAEALTEGGRQATDDKAAWRNLKPFNKRIGDVQDTWIRNRAGGDAVVDNQQTIANNLKP